MQPLIVVWVADCHSPFASWLQIKHKARLKHMSSVCLAWICLGSSSQGSVLG